MNEPSGRIEGYDLARALAVFGMVIVNYKVVMGAEQLGPAVLIRVLNLLDGRAAALFVILAGVGISLLSRRARVRQDLSELRIHRCSLHWRGFILFVVGLAYWPLWPADILHFYGVYIAVSAFLLAASSRQLLSVAVGFVLVAMAMLVTLDYDQGIDWVTLDYQGFWTFEGFLRNLFFNGFHPVFPWTAFLLVGMVIGRMDLTAGAIRGRLLLIGLGLVLIAEATSWWLSLRMPALATTPEELEDLLAVVDTAPMPPTPFYVLAGIGWSAIVIVLCVTLSQAFPRSGWLKPLVLTGQLAFTLYVAHVVVGMGVLEAMGRLERQPATVALIAALIFCVAGVGFSVAWRSRFAFGPLEHLLRRLG